MRTRVFIVCFACLLCGFRCSLPLSQTTFKELIIVSYNAHNLFDDVDEGREYPEFSIAKGSWSSELYSTRLENTAAAITSLFPGKESYPDIICFEEIESIKVLQDLAAGPLKKGGYRWAVVGGQESSAIRCGILSRLPAESVKLHGLADSWGFGVGRDMIEASFEVPKPGQNKETARLTLFVCHWKSRKEGAKETEVARKAGAGLLLSRINEISSASASVHIVALGDFNESPDEFFRVEGQYPTAFMPEPESVLLGMDRIEIPPEWYENAITLAFTENTALTQNAYPVLSKVQSLYSPWRGSEDFSYIFEGEKERLDGFLLNKTLQDGAGLEFSAFEVASDPLLFDAEGKPQAWSGSGGYSDHLPIGLILTFTS